MHLLFYYYNQNSSCYVFFLDYIQEVRAMYFLFLIIIKKCAMYIPCYSL